jgi:hypothetical protein
MSWTHASTCPHLCVSSRSIQVSSPSVTLSQGPCNILTSHHHSIVAWCLGCTETRRVYHIVVIVQTACSWK